MTPERWLWASESPGARLARRVLWGPALAYGVAARMRAGAYRTGLLRTRRVGLPVVAVGNLTVGGTGKTPLAAWIASYYASRGVTPGVVLRGYGRDEGGVHRAATPSALVVEDPSRLRGASRALRDGAQVIVLDDAFQRLDVHRDLNVAVISAESLAAQGELLPAGPWREAWPALQRADFIVVTRKQATRQAADEVARRAADTLGPDRVALAHLRIRGFSGLRSRGTVDLDVVKGRRVLAACGIGDPESFAAQLRELGADVRLQAWRDHHHYRLPDIRAVLSAARTVDYVVVTAKDAVKLAGLWPADDAEPLVADLAVSWEAGGEQVAAALNNAITMTCDDTRVQLSA